MKHQDQNSPYQRLLSRLYSFSLQRGRKLGLDNPLRLCKELGRPQASYPCIHIAGTNGKGSVATKVAKGLESRYSHVGLFTSPHISSFRERIRINGEIIDEEDIVGNLEKIFALAEEMGILATFFEFTTALAFHYFAQRQVKIAVIETGLGGRLDATNILSPLLTVITSISLDHTDVLGKTHREIAKEKAGIIKPGIPTILGPSAHCVPVPSETPCIKVCEVGEHVEVENQAIARAVLEHLDIPEKVIKKALTTRPPCRGEVLEEGGKSVMMDVAHNPDALFKLFRWIDVPPHRLSVICGLSKEKDLSACLTVIGRHAGRIHLVPSPNGRCAQPEHLAGLLSQQGFPSSRVTIHHSIKESVHHVLSHQQNNEQRVLICGSFYIMSEARQALNIEEPRDPVCSQ
ncbi:MAG: Mur ligase family protein [Waddliaceae bacterium]